jgi:alanine racemase
MGLRLSVHREPWQRQLNSVASEFDGIIPVVKGNGYGFGRSVLMPIAATLSDVIAVGTVYEAQDVPRTRTALVLTPHLEQLPAHIAQNTILTIGARSHLDALTRQSWRGQITIKLRSSMRRYGAAPNDLVELTTAAEAAGLTVAGYGIHFPLSGDPIEHLGEIEQWLPLLDNAVPLALSHATAEHFQSLRQRFPARKFQIRCGTSLWHADRPSLKMTADVLDVVSIRADVPAGYRGNRARDDGSLVLVSAGSAHGLGPLANGLSPFHFNRQRIMLFEPPHMHTSMLFIPVNERCPVVGDRVDVQHPLTMTMVDELEWIDD